MTGDVPSVLLDENGFIRLGGEFLIKGQQWHTRALLDLLMIGARVPFRECDVCGRIFERKGRQERCSKSCTQKANDRKRSRTKKRREQTRKAVKRHRAKKKKQAKVAGSAEGRRK